MKPIDVRFASLSKCCCCSLAAGTITWTVILALGAILDLVMDASTARIVGIVINILRVVLLIWGLAKYNWIVLLILCSLVTLDVLLNLIYVLAVRLPVILKLESDVRGPQVFGLIIALAVYLLITIYFISIILSLANVYMVFGTGWESKNWKQIKEENESKNKDNEDKKRDAEDDIEISH